MSLDRAANLFGALATVIADQSADAMADAGGRSESSAAALSALLHFLGAPSVDLLRQVLGLSPSGTVRLLDRLEESGYVRRGPGDDGRSVSVTLTESGRAAAERVTAARAGVLERALEVLSPPERQAFEQLAGKVLVGMMRGPGAVRWICRRLRHGRLPWGGRRLPGRQHGPRTLPFLIWAGWEGSAPRAMLNWSVRPGR